MHYQPLVDIATDRISGFEPLLRRRHPDRGMISLADFIPLAADIGLIVPIGEWVLRGGLRRGGEITGGSQGGGQAVAGSASASRSMISAQADLADRADCVAIVRANLRPRPQPERQRRR